MTPETVRISGVALLPPAVIIAVVTGHAYLAGPLVDGLLALTGVVCLLLAAVLVVRRLRAGAVVLDLGAPPGHARAASWAVFWAGASVGIPLLGYRWSWAVFALGQAAFYAVQGTARVEVRDAGLSGVPWGVLPWTRIHSYQVGTADVRLSYRPGLGQAARTLTLAFPAPHALPLCRLLAHYLPRRASDPAGRGPSMDEDDTGRSAQEREGS